MRYSDKKSREENYLCYRLRYLPIQIEAARRKLVALEREAARLGMHDLIQRGGQ